MPKLTPVDYDPFAKSTAPKLTPVDYDPFAPKPYSAAPQQVTSPVGQPGLDWQKTPAPQPSVASELLAPWKRLPGNIAVATLEPAANISTGIADIAKSALTAGAYAADKTGIEGLRGGALVKPLEKFARTGGEQLKKEAEYVTREMGLEKSTLPEKVVKGVFGAPLGIAEFTIGPAWAGISKAATTYEQTGDIKEAALSGARSTGEWFAMKGILDAGNKLNLAPRAAALSTAFASQAAANGGTEDDIIEAGALGLAFAGMGGGNKTSKQAYKEFVDSVKSGKNPEDTARLEQARVEIRKALSGIDKGLAEQEFQKKVAETPVQEGGGVKYPEPAKPEPTIADEYDALMRQAKDVQPGTKEAEELKNKIEDIRLKQVSLEAPEMAGAEAIPEQGKINSITREEAGRMAEQGDPALIDHIKEGIRLHGIEDVEQGMAAELSDRSVMAEMLGDAKTANNLREASQRVNELIAAERAKPAEAPAPEQPTPQVQPEPAPTVEAPLATEKTVDELTSPQVLASGGLPAQGTRTADVTGSNIERRLEAKYETARQTKEAAQTILNNFREEIYSGRRGGEKGRIPVKEDIDRAANIGIDLKKVMKANKGRAPLGVELRAIENATLDSMNEVTRLSSKVRQGTATDIEKLQLVAHIEDVVQLERYLTGQVAEWGRAGRVLRESVESGKAQRHVADILRGLQERGLSPEQMAREIGGIEDVKDAIKLIKDKNAPTWWDKYFEYVNNAMLTNPVTYVKNAIGNTLAVVLAPPTRAVSGQIDYLRSKATGKEREVFASESIQQMMAMSTGIKVGARQMIEAWKDPERAYSDMKIEVQHAGGAIGGKAGKIIRTPWRILGSTDAFFKGLVGTMETHALAHRQALKEAKGDVKKYEARLTELLDNPTDAILEGAQKEARHRAFQDDLGSIGRAIMKLRNSDVYGAKPLQVVLPYIKTPANLAKFTVKHSPLGFPVAAIKYARALRGKADMTSVELNEELAKAAVGSTIFAAFATAALENVITGGGPPDKNEWAALRATGWQPYSIKIGDTYYSYANSEPVGMLIGLAADSMEALRYGKMDDKTAGDVIAKIGLSMGKNLTDRTYMKGLSNAMDAVNDPDKEGRKWLGDTMTQPIPSGVSAIARIRDPELKYNRDLLDDVRERTPGLRETMEPNIDIWGKPIRYEGSGITRAFSPFWVSADRHDSLSEELVRLKLYKGRVKQEGRTPKEYTAYAKLAGTMARQEAERMFNSPYYQKADDETKRKLLSDAINNGRKAARDKLAAQ